MNLHVNYHDKGRHVPEGNRFDYLKDQGWSTLEILRLFQAEDRRQHHKEDTDETHQ